MKTYDIKTYDRLKNYKSTINPNKIMSKISFTSNLDGGQGQLTLDLTTDVNIDCGDIVEVYCYDEFHKTGILIFSGFASESNNIYSSSKTYNSIKCLGLGSLLSCSYYTTGGTVTDTIEGHINTLCTDYNTIYGSDLFSVGVIEDSSTIAISISDEGTFFQKLQTIVKSGDNFFYVDQYGKINVYKRPSVATHLLTYKKNVEEIKLSYNIESVVNQYRIKAYCGGDGGNYEQTYEDTDSISQYGVRSYYKATSDYYKRAGVDSRANGLLQENSTPKNNTQVVVNSLYDIITVRPGESIAIMNIDKNIDNLQIKKINYSSDKITLTLEEQEKFSEYLQFKK